MLRRIVQHLQREDCPGVALLEPLRFDARSLVDQVHASALVNLRTAADYALRVLVHGQTVLSTCATGMVIVDGVTMAPRVTWLRRPEPL